MNPTLIVGLIPGNFHNIRGVNLQGTGVWVCQWAGDEYSISIWDRRDPVSMNVHDQFLTFWAALDAAVTFASLGNWNRPQAEIKADRVLMHAAKLWRNALPGQRVLAG